jgi:hypothetical protein
MKNKLLLLGLILSLGLIFSSGAIEYGPTVLTYFGQTINDPVTMVVVIEETNIKEGGQPTNYRDVLNGATANALRTANKWRQWDKDQVPKDFQPLKDEAVKAQAESGKFTPQMFVLHDTKVSWKGSLPKTDAELSERVQSQGGL